MFWLVFLTAFLLDQFTKLLAPLYVEVSLNPGISFGWLSQLPFGLTTFLLIVLMVGIAIALRREWGRHRLISGLFWAGAISNLVDRLLLGAVSDWLPLPYFTVKNNLADIYLSVALLMLLVQELRSHHEN